MRPNRTSMSSLDGWRQPVAGASLALAAGFFAAVFLCYTFGLIALAIGGTVKSSFFLAACVGAVGVTVWAAYREGLSRRSILILVILLLALIWASLSVAADFFDVSWDGQAYHEESIIQLARGANPFYGVLGQETVNIDRQLNFIWYRHYPKATWIFSAAVYLLTGDIDSGKAYQSLLAAMAFLLVFSAALRLREMPFWAALLMGGLAAANPVTICQSLNYYVDGALASSIGAIAALSAMLFMRPNWFLGIFWAAVAILAINLKFTGIPYVMIAGFGLACIALVAGKFDVARLTGGALVCGVVLGVVVFGFDPYVKNTISHGNIFFPVRGQGAVDIMGATTPEPLKQMARFEKLEFSLFHESSNSHNPSVQLKIPLTVVSNAEITAFEAADVVLGGWGPLFGGTLLLALAAALVWLVLATSSPLMYLMTVSVSLVVASVLINPEAWWARYTPQLCLVPLIISAAFILQGAKLWRMFGAVIGLLMLLNAGLVAKGYFLASYWTTMKAQEELALLARNPLPITVYFSEFPGLRLRLAQAGVRFTPVIAMDQLPCQTPLHFSKLAGFVSGDVAYCNGDPGAP